MLYQVGDLQWRGHTNYFILKIEKQFYTFFAFQIKEIIYLPSDLRQWCSQRNQYRRHAQLKLLIALGSHVTVAESRLTAVYEDLSPNASFLIHINKLLTIKKRRSKLSTLTNTCCYHSEKKSGSPLLSMYSQMPKLFAFK